MWRDKLVYISKKVALIKKEDREKSVDKRNSDVKKNNNPTLLTVNQSWSQLNGHFAYVKVFSFSSSA